MASYYHLPTPLASRRDDGESSAIRRAWRVRGAEYTLTVNFVYFFGHGDWQRRTRATISWIEAYAPCQEVYFYYSSR